MQYTHMHVKNIHHTGLYAVQTRPLRIYYRPVRGGDDLCYTGSSKYFYLFIGEQTFDKLLSGVT